MKKEKKIEDYSIKLAGQLFANKKYYCVFCGREIKGFRDRLSVQEFRISGLCQDCQDKTFGEKNY